MKRVIVSLVTVALLFALGAAALSEVWHMYSVEDDVPVYAEKDREAKVVYRLERGERVDIEEVSKSGKWYAVYYEKNGKQKVGWVEAKYLSDTRPCNHKWGEWQVYRQATCIETGLRIRTCSRCGASEAVDIDKLPHTFGKWKIIKEATCTREGRQTHECKLCGFEEEQKIDKLPHSYGEWMTELEPTCTDTGLRVHKCEECGYEEEKTIEKLPHEFGEWKIVIEATDHSSGTRRRTCAVCGENERASYDPEGTLRRGDRGDAVREIQTLLAEQGYLKGSGIDGIFGGGVEKSVMQFQLDQGLSPDGVAWPQTIRRLHHEYGPWRTVKKLERDVDGERARTCAECGYEQRQTVKAGAVYERRARGEAIRTVQTMLNDLGYPAGTADGIYGQKLDDAYGRLADERRLDGFEPGRLTPGNVDALVNAWIAEQIDTRWIGQEDDGATVDLVLRVKATEDSDPGDDMWVFDWTLTNQGPRACRFDALLLNYHGNPDFTADNLAMAVDGFTLKPNGANTVGGTFSVGRDWGAGKLHFAAVATDERTGDIYLSNTRRYTPEG